MSQLLPNLFAVCCRSCRLVCLLFLGAVNPVIAQEVDAGNGFLIRTWDARNGLPGGTSVLAIQRTADGFLWIATRKGLVRFDGVRFVVFDSQRIPEFRNDVISSLLCDRRGRLWVGTQAGLVRIESGSFDLSKRQSVWFGGQPSALAQDAQGTVWAAVPQTGLVGFHEQDATVVTNEVKVEPSASLLAGSSNQLWLVSKSAIWAGKKGSWQKLPALPKDLAALTAAGSGADSKLWLAAGIKVFNLDQFSPLAAAPGVKRSQARLDGVVSTLIKDRKQRLWAGTLGGLIFCYTDDSGWQQFNASRARPPGGDQCFYEDNDGSIWVGMGAGELLQIKSRPVNAWPLPVAAQGNIPEAVCPAADGSVWVGTDGAGVFQLKDESFRRFGKADGLVASTVMAILEDRQTNLWFGTTKGVFRFESGRFVPLKIPELENFTVSALYEDHAGNIWFGATLSLVCLRQGRVEVYEMAKPPPDSIDFYEIRAISEDATGVIWVGTRQGGLFQLDGGRLERRTDFPGHAVTAILGEGQGGAIWIATEDSGLYQLDPQAIRHWGLSDGLPVPGNTIYNVVQDKRGMLWMSSKEGIFGLRKTDLMFYEPGVSRTLLPVYFGAEDGMNDAGCFASGQPSAAMGADGRIWFPTLHGIVAIQAEMMKTKQQPLSVMVEEIVVDGVAHSSAHLSELRVPSTARRLEIRYTIPELLSPSRVNFQFRLAGYEDQWVAGNQQRVAVYGHLPAGTYKFQLMAGTGAGWQPAAQKIAIHIVPQIWERRGFQLTGAVALLALLALAIRSRERARVRRKLAIQRATEQERSRIAKDLHDDLGSGLTEIMLLGELAQRHKGTDTEMVSKVASLTDKARRVAAALDEAVWMVNPKSDLLPSFAGNLADAAREFLQVAAVRCRVSVPDDLPPLILSAATKHNLLLAVKEALNNAVRHSGADEVSLQIDVRDEKLSVCITDAGCGFDPGQAVPQGNGLANLRSRLETLGGSARIESQPGQGTRVHLTLTLDQASAQPAATPRES